MQERTRQNKDGAKAKHQPIKMQCECKSYVGMNSNAKRTATPARARKGKGAYTRTKKKKKMDHVECPARQESKKKVANQTDRRRKKEKGLQQGKGGLFNQTIKKSF